MAQNTYLQRYSDSFNEQDIHPTDENAPSDEITMDPAARIAAELASVDEPEDSLPPVQLADLSDKIQDACTNAGWRSLMPVQAHALPYLMAGRDLMVQSRTGSGKTGAFILPLLERLDPTEATTQALVLVPTRELALQVEYEAKTIFAGTGIRVAATYGGVGYGKQVEALRAGAQFVVGTPGRVLDHLLRRTMQLDDLRALTFDEADRMLSIGFYPDMKEIQRYLPRRSITTCLFSATYPQHVLNLASEFMREPQMLSLSHKQVHVAQTHHTYCEARPMEKDRALVRLIEMENPTSAIIFCNTKANVHYVTAVLQGFGYNADELCADLSQSKRERVLERLRNNEVRFLVATDVAARGIDIPNLSHVFLYEPPEDRESYIHRAGRTGRAGCVGTVISLVDIMQKIELQRIAQHYRMDIPQRPTPQDEDVAHVVTARLTALLEADYRRLTGLQKERLKRFTTMAHDIANDEDQVALIAMLLDAHYQQTLHDTPPLPKPEVREHRERQQPRQERQGQRQAQRQNQRQGQRDDRPRGDAERNSKRNSPRNAERGHDNRQYNSRNGNLEADRHANQNERRMDNERRPNSERHIDDDRPSRPNRRAPRRRKQQGDRSE